LSSSFKFFLIAQKSHFAAGISDCPRAWPVLTEDRARRRSLLRQPCAGRPAKTWRWQVAYRRGELPVRIALAKSASCHFPKPVATSGVRLRGAGPLHRAPSHLRTIRLLWLSLVRMTNLVAPLVPPRLPKLGLKVQ